MVATATVAVVAIARRGAKQSARAVSAGAQQLLELPTGARGFATPKKKATPKKGKKSNEDSNFELMLRNIKGRYPDAEPWTEEEQQRFQAIGHRYNVQTTIDHNHWMRDVQTKIDLKWDAINALPAHLQQEALEDDVSPIPEERGFATWTPPIEGFRRFSDQESE